MKALIAGGAGFIGSHLCDALLSKGYDVICVDNLLTGSRNNITHLLDNHKFQFIEHDVVNKLPDNVYADEVYHLASPASPNIHSDKSYHALPFETMLANTTGTWQLCEFAGKNNATLFYASTSEAYGDPKEHPQKETYRGNVSTTGPRSVYDEAKRFGETIVAANVRYKNLDGRIVRIFNTYGPRMSIDDGRVTIEFISKALKNEPLPIFGKGNQTRAFCYISDMISGILAVMGCDEVRGQVINLGSPDEFTVNEFAAKVKEVTGSQSEITYPEALPQDDPLKRQPDINKAKEVLNWEPKVSLEEGIRRMVEWLKG